MIKRVLYIVPSTSRSWKNSILEKTGSPPLGIALLTSLLRLNGYIVKIIDMLVENIGPRELKKNIEDFKPDIIGISASFTECIENAYQMMRFIKEYYNIPIMAGGVHCTFNPEETLENGADYVIIGEGEAPTIQLLAFLNYGLDKEYISTIRGVGFAVNNGCKINYEKMTVEDLGCLPFAALLDLPLDRYVTPISLVTSRGCPGDCVYCASRAMFGKKYRIRSAESIFSECYYLYYKYKGNKELLDTYMAIFDDTFTVNKQRLKKFCTYMIDSGLNKKISWKCESRIDVLNDEIIELMAHSGCIALHMGIESIDQKVVDSLNKHINLSEIEKIFKSLKKYGIRPLCSFIIGNHSDTHETLDKTEKFIQYINKKYNAKIAISPNTPLPGTALYNDPEKYGINIKSKIWSDYSLMKVIIDTTNLTQDDIRNHYARIINLIDNMEE